MYCGFLPKQLLKFSICSSKVICITSAFGDERPLVVTWPTLRLKPFYSLTRIITASEPSETVKYLSSPNTILFSCYPMNSLFQENTDNIGSQQTVPCARKSWWPRNRFQLLSSLVHPRICSNSGLYSHSGPRSSFHLHTYVPLKTSLWYWHNTGNDVAELLRIYYFFNPKNEYRVHMYSPKYLSWAR